MRFEKARSVFEDPLRIVMEDLSHSNEAESRYFCIGYDGTAIATVRFTLRDETIRIFGAGYWRKGKRAYEQKNNIHR